MIYFKQILENVILDRIFFVLSFLSLIFLNSCSSGASSATGWGFNDPANGGFSVNTGYSGQQAAPGLVFIEGGSFIMGRSRDDVMADWNVTSIRKHVPSFFMDETEVTNVMYREYLFWLQRVFPPSEEFFKNIYKSALPDTLVWRDRFSYNEVYVNNYLRHPAYNDYPVVGVSWVQATKYAEWRTDRVNEKALIDLGVLKDVNGSKDKIIKGGSNFVTDAYLDDPEKVFGGNTEGVYERGLPDYTTSSEEVTNSNFEGRHVNVEDGILLPKYRLPTEAEWEYAALALIGERTGSNVEGGRLYPWSGKKLTDDDGYLLANFKLSQGNYSGVAGWTTDKADVTAPVKSYPPNDYGLYDMAGNVSEWVLDVYRPSVQGEGDLEDFKYHRGNIFKKSKLDAEGNRVRVGEEEIKYDTLATGRIMAKNLPGQLLEENITPNDTYMRKNYQISDNRDYLDGDELSVKASFGAKKPMYNDPKNTVEVDNTGKITGKYDTKGSTFINNDVRVYKGGSWADRAFWLDPSNRRFLHQDLSNAFIGFRCAMDKLGEVSLKGRQYEGVRQ
ncbi:gliding motility lipoprotein GldJ [Ichthyobacterium seriolicida]|uniref:Gliding motility protein GldJ n=1 Tax=Ichthyobacterium seriolicida TaxID=242600 RepID=A0A1J1DXL1_9FLAO|nr:gliding motility lipoprotein GldJ [Ichthyobacterium seriolicida]BAV94569.1 gliding motility protein GldJ [Ichthyobacterium seriolicida]